MRVCKHGCGVKLFGFSRANHPSTNLKKYSSSKLDKITLFTHSFVGWNMENRYKDGETNYLRLSWHFKREKSVFCKASFCKTGTDRPLALRGLVTNTSLKQLVGILLMPKIDGTHKNYLTPEIWKEKHLREIFHGTLILQQSSMICIGRHVGGHTLALQHGGQN